MNLRVFGVRDSAVEAFLPPFFARHRGEAMRMFVSAVNDENHQFSKNKSDFVLYELGSFDDASGLFDPSNPARIVSAIEVVKSE